MINRLRDETIHAPTVGILLRKDRDEAGVRYTLTGAPAPTAVATCTYDTPTPEQRAGLPNPTQLTDQLVNNLIDALQPPASAADEDTNPAHNDR